MRYSDGVEGTADTYAGVSYVERNQNQGTEQNQDRTCDGVSTRSLYSCPCEKARYCIVSLLWVLTGAGCICRGCTWFEGTSLSLLRP